MLDSIIKEVLKQDSNEAFIDGSTVYYGTDFQPYIDDAYQINVHELMTRCKEYALDKGVFIESGLPYKNRATAAVFNAMGGFLEGFEDTTEYSAVFSAIIWIMKRG
jgi:hypothetical protein